MKTHRVVVRTQQASEAIEYPAALGTYQKCDLLCVFFVDSQGVRKTHKYPVQNLFRVEEDYPETDKGKVQ